MYSIQIAAANVSKTTFGQADAEMVTEIKPEDAAMEAHNQRMEKLKRIEKVKTPPMNTEDTDLKREQSLPRMDADERGSEKQNLPLMNTEDTDLRTTTAEGGCATRSSLAPEVYANRSQTSEVRANLG